MRLKKGIGLELCLTLVLNAMNKATLHKIVRSRWSFLKLRNSTWEMIFWAMSLFTSLNRSLTRQKFWITKTGLIISKDSQVCHKCLRHLKIIKSTLKFSISFTSSKCIIAWLVKVKRILINLQEVMMMQRTTYLRRTRFSLKKKEKILKYNFGLAT